MANGSTDGDLRRGPGRPAGSSGTSWGWVLFFGIATLIIGLLVVIHPRTPSAFGHRPRDLALRRRALPHRDGHRRRRGHGRHRWLMAFLGLLAVIIGDPLPPPHRRDGDHARLPDRPLLARRRDHRVLHRVQRPRVGRPGLADRDGSARLRGRHRHPGVAEHHPGVLAGIMGIWLIIYALLEIILAFHLRRLVH